MASNRGTLADWLIFVALGVMWGSSYLFIMIGLDTLTPFTLVALRLAVGAALLVAVIAVARERLPRDLGTYGHLVVLSVLSIVLPFSLITWAELAVASSVASILVATVPLFVIVIAAGFLRDEPMTLNGVAGLAIGFAGVVLLTGRGPMSSDGGLLPVLALLGAAASYGAGGVYARRTVHHLRPMVPSVIQVVFGFAISTALAFAFERPLDLRPDGAAWLSILWLGVFGSGLAYLAFFRLLGTFGATRTSMVAYLMPVVGIVLGVAVAAEPIDLRMVAGTVLIIGGVALVNTRYGRRRLFGRREVARGQAG
ncbi:MAG TPA: EamA family transporter [Candidatus Angelobacter sp.]|nr:EamA family transporter [Candidatus Angelobacter sp.]